MNDSNKFVSDVSEEDSEFIWLNSSEDCLDVNEFFYKSRQDLTEFTVTRLTVGIVYSFIFILGAVGNISMLCSIRDSQKKRHSNNWTVANILLANLGVSDLLLCLTAVPLTPAQILFKIWYFGSFMCKLTPFAQAVSVLVSSLTLCSIAGDRYWSIVDTSRKRLGRSYAILTICLLWLLAILVNLPLFLSMELGKVGGKNYMFCGEFCEESKWPNISLQKMYGTMILCLQFALPVVLLAYCYFEILLKVRQDLVVDHHNLLTGDQMVRAARRKKRVTYILIMMVLAYILSWLPLTLANILRDYGIDYQQQIYLIHISVHAVAMTSVVWNPILYFWMSESGSAIGRGIQTSLRSQLVGMAKLEFLIGIAKPQYAVTPARMTSCSRLSNTRNISNSPNIRLKSSAYVSSVGARRTRYQTTHFSVGEQDEKLSENGLNFDVGFRSASQPPTLLINQQFQTDLTLPTEHSSLLPSPERRSCFSARSSSLPLQPDK